METIYDLASLTKVVATTAAAMLLEEDGRLQLDTPVHVYLPEPDAPDKATMTVRMLLAHRAGFEAFAPLYREPLDEFVRERIFLPLGVASTSVPDQAAAAGSSRSPAALLRGAAAEAHRVAPP